jgi:hypothetical protein
MTRKVIQIAATTYGATGDEGELRSDLYALCDDGTIWNYFGRGWALMEPIPQIEEDEAL